MKYSRLFLFILSGVFLLTILRASPSHAVLMKITDGTYTPYAGDTRSISGYVNFLGDRNVHLFNGAPAEIYFDGLDPILSDSGYLEMQWLYEDRTDLFFWRISEDYLGRWFSMWGTVYYEAEIYYEYNPQIHYPYAVNVKYRSLELDIGIHYLQSNEVDNIHLVAQTPVPEPATMLLLASGLVGLAGLRRKIYSRK